MKLKAGFPLECSDGWPPYSVEHLWLEKVGELYKIKNLPLYIKGISLGDIISANIDDDGYVIEWELIHASNNSTVWIIEHSPTSLGKSLVEIGCDIETDDNTHLISVNVPQTVQYDDLDSLLKPLEEEGAISVAMPVDRMSP